MSDDPGVMGNLPRSRPGRRSSKRDGGGKAAVSATGGVAPTSAPKAGGGKSAAGRAKKPAAASRPAARQTAPRQATPRKAAASAEQKPRQTERKQPEAEPAARQEAVTQGSTDPITGAVLLAGKVVEGGLKVAGGIIKRLPRP